MTVHRSESYNMVNYHTTSRSGVLPISQVVEHLVILGLLSSIVLPSVEFMSLGVRFTTFIAPILLIMVVYRASVLSKFNMHKSTLFLALLGLMVFLSSVVSYIFLNVFFSIGDFLESVKYIQFIPYLLALPLITCGGVFIKFHYYMLVSVIIFLIVGFSQIFQINPLVHILGSLYSGETHLQTMLDGGRIFITGSDANIGASIAFFLLLYLVIVSFEVGKKIYMFLALPMVFLLLMTQSRTALLGAVLAMVAYALIVKKMNIVFKIVILLIIFAAFYYLVLSLNLEYLILGYQTLMTGENESVNVRIENIVFACDRFRESLLFGWGPAKSIHETVIDSEYALIIQRYGLLGVTLFTSLMIYLFKVSSSSMKGNSQYRFSGIILFLYIVYSFVLMATNNVFSGYQLMSILILLLILCLKSQSIIYNPKLSRQQKSKRHRRTILGHVIKR